MPIYRRWMSCLAAPAGGNAPLFLSTYFHRYIPFSCCLLTWIPRPPTTAQVVAVRDISRLVKISLSRTFNYLTRVSEKQKIKIGFDHYMSVLYIFDPSTCFHISTSPLGVKANWWRIAERRAISLGDKTLCWSLDSLWGKMYNCDSSDFFVVWIFGLSFFDWMDWWIETRRWGHKKTLGTQSEEPNIIRARKTERRAECTWNRKDNLMADWY